MSRRFRRRPLAGLAALVGLGLLAAGCSGGGGAAAPGGLEKTNLNVAAVPAVDSAGLYIAQQRGLFAAEGLHVSILPAISGKTTIDGQLAGEFDVTSGNYVSYILANAADPQARLPGPRAGSIMEANNQDIMVPPNSRIKTVSELKQEDRGQRDPQHRPAPGQLGSQRQRGTGGQQFVPVEFPDMATALQDHTVDAAWMPDPFITEAEEKIGAVPLADSNQGTTENLPIAGYMVTASWLKKYPNTAAAFRRALIKAQTIAANAPAPSSRAWRPSRRCPRSPRLSRPARSTRPR